MLYYAGVSDRKRDCKIGYTESVTFKQEVRVVNKKIPVSVYLLEEGYYYKALEEIGLTLGVLGADPVYSSNNYEDGSYIEKSRLMLEEIAVVIYNEEKGTLEHYKIKDVLKFSIRKKIEDLYLIYKKGITSETCKSLSDIAGFYTGNKLTKYEYEKRIASEKTREKYVPKLTKLTAWELQSCYDSRTSRFMLKDRLELEGGEDEDDIYETYLSERLLYKQSEKNQLDCHIHVSNYGVFKAAEAIAGAGGIINYYVDMRDVRRNEARAGMTEGLLKDIFFELDEEASSGRPDNSVGWRNVVLQNTTNLDKNFMDDLVGNMSGEQEFTNDYREFQNMSVYVNGEKHSVWRSNKEYRREELCMFKASIPEVAEAIREYKRDGRRSVPDLPDELPPKHKPIIEINTRFDNMRA